MGRQGSRRWGRKENKQQKQQHKSKGSKTAKANNAAPMTNTTKSASMTLAGVKHGAIALVSGFARHCWGGWGMAKSSASTHVAHTQTCPPTPSSTHASPAVHNDAEASTPPPAVAAAAAVAPAAAAAASTPPSTPKFGRATTHSTRSMSAPCRLETLPAPAIASPTFERMANVMMQVGLVGKEAATLALPHAVRTALAARVQQYSAWLQTEIHGFTELTRFHFQFCSWEFMVRMAGSFLQLFAASYACAVASVIAGVRTPNMLILDLIGRITGLKTLPDLGHDATAYVLKALGYETDYVDIHHLPDTIVSWLGALFFLLLALHPLRCLIFRRVTIIMSYLFWLRSITVLLTGMPDPSPKCQAQFGSPSGYYKSQPVFPRAFDRAWVYMLDPTNHTTCGDMIFSGHTTVMMVVALVFYYFCRDDLIGNNVLFRKLAAPKWTCAAIRYGVYLMTIVGVASVVATRFHYSIDVFLAAYFSLNTFIGYHCAIDYSRLKGWWGPLGNYLRWMEAEQIIAVDRDAEGLVEKEMLVVRKIIEKKSGLSAAEIESMTQEIISGLKDIPNNEKGPDANRLE